MDAAAGADVAAGEPGVDGELCRPAAVTAGAAACADVPTPAGEPAATCTGGPSSARAGRTPSAVASDDVMSGAAVLVDGASGEDAFTGLVVSPAPTTDG
ncbi:hypothetical protein [Micromonospora sp. LOL_021]|uniref:hypothetical protein n=1 Tax=Micromonospora sp. LOL_021 TaxID=3345417 RepID=UPI003A88BE71